jgi:T-complex protein 1 subunit zeta
MFRLFEKDLYKDDKPLGLAEDAADEIERRIETNFGPNGMYKFTEDGAVLSSAIEIVNSLEKSPFMDILAKEAEAQDEECSDGTATVAILTEKLLKEASLLKDQGLQAPVIIKGYLKASDTIEEEIERLKGEMDREDVEGIDRVLRDVLSKHGYEKLGSHIRDSFLFLSDEELRDDSASLWTDEKSDKAEVIKGLVLDYNKKREDMPDKVENAKVLLLYELKTKKPAYDAKIRAGSVEDYRGFVDAEREDMKRIAERIAELGVNFVAVKGEMSDIAAELFARKGIIAVEKVKEKDLGKMARATGAKLTTVYDISAEYVGSCGAIETESGSCTGGVCHV